MKAVTRLWTGIALLIALTPLGLLLPRWLGSGPAWGEWGTEEVKGILGFIPKGLERLSGLWHAPMQDYAVAGKGSGSSYVFSALAGTAVVVAVILLLGKVLAKKDE